MPTDYERVADAIRFLTDNAAAQPPLGTVAAASGLSPGHFQRVFRRWAGVSPKRFLQYLTVEHAKACLDASSSVLDAALAAGLSGPGRLHDHFVALEAATPGDYRRRGAGMEIVYGWSESPFGGCFVARTDRGICGLGFVTVDGIDAELSRLRRAWAAARLVRDDGSAAVTVAQLFERAYADAPLSLLVSGTNFQVQVWRALLRVPPGQVVTYGALAAAIGRPGASRATGAAVGANPIGWLIPCHRVIRASGEIGGYRWGPVRKRAMLGFEAAAFDSVANRARAG